MILKWLLHHLLFGFTMFAAAAPAIGGGSTSGGNDAGAGDSSGVPISEGTGGTGTDRGNAGGNDDRSRSVGAEDAEGASNESDFGSFEDDFGADDTTAEPTNHEEFGPDTYKAVKEALKQQPEVFKAVKKAIGMVKRYQEHFETPEKAGEFLSDVQSLGGWDTIKQDVMETATFLNGYNAGDKEVVSKWLEENQDGLLKNMPTILDKWRAADNDAWAHDAANTFKATLLQPNEQTGLSPIAALRKLGQIEGVKDSDEYKTIMQRIDGVMARADQAPANKPAASKGPDETKLTAREQQVKQQEQNLRRQALGGKAQPLLNKEAANALQLVAGGKKLSPQAKTDLVNDIHREFARLMEKDVDGKQKRQKLLQVGQDEQWLKMVKSGATRTMPQAARNVWRKYAGISGISEATKQQRRSEGQQRKEAGTGSASNQGLQSLSPGDGRQVDWDAMRAKFGGRDKADEIFSFGLKDKFGGKRVWMKKGDPATIYTY